MQHTFIVRLSAEIKVEGFTDKVGGDFDSRDAFMAQLRECADDLETDIQTLLLFLFSEKFDTVECWVEYVKLNPIGKNKQANSAGNENV